MTQEQAVVEALRRNGSYLPLGRLYQETMRIPGCRWGTKTPFASIRRIVKQSPNTFKIRPGLFCGSVLLQPRAKSRQVRDRVYNERMDAALRLKTTVLPGRRIEIETPELAEGDSVEVTITPAARPEPRRSMLELVRSLNGHRLLQTPADADRYLHEERDSWDR